MKYIIIGLFRILLLWISIFPFFFILCFSFLIEGLSDLGGKEINFGSDFLLNRYDKYFARGFLDW